MAAIDPLHQFAIEKVVALPPVNVPGLGLIDMSITNSVVAMLIAAVAICLFFGAAAKGAAARMAAAAASAFRMLR
jgi:F-type H+-transporting ATPase subunit a